MQDIDDSYEELTNMVMKVGVSLLGYENLSSNCKSIIDGGIKNGQFDEADINSYQAGHNSGKFDNLTDHICRTNNFDDEQVLQELSDSGLINSDFLECAKYE